MPLDEKPDACSETALDFDLALNRRDFGRDFIGLAIAGGTATLAEGQVVSEPASNSSHLDRIPVKLTINGKEQQVETDVRTSLLDLLRNNLAMTGTKKGCDHGQCGACTVLVNGRRTLSCLSFAVMHAGDSITTVEGLAQGDQLHPVQAAFIEHDGFQCGYCTPGQICSAVALLDEIKRNEPSRVTPNLTSQPSIELTDEEIRERMSGNLCRCGAYLGIVAAIRAAHSGNGSSASTKESA